ncbi:MULTISPECIES: DUF2938 domain-containing protein [unclassified Motilimonas]|uniref:DUF2938 domain-containing protein n=1 Tax=Motilimonas TaxID=1914248 RepID=UPI001E652579|nr:MULTISPECIES: DUF2938 domain-containing protein [unclassified Motilimonas]MCE0559252.1 DUF2938 domain-containing protein [Motilimonas sp. E26]MDO6527477.1 DUF2938 domain-containing protein [Motilimonas sp. 1_MG-2023]
MSDELSISQLVANTLLIGIGATAIMDFWAILLQRVFGIVPLNYAVVGRWLAYIPKGTISHDNIGAVKPVNTEAIIGWVAHYLIGAIFTAVFVMYMGKTWLIAPSIFPAMAFGALTVALPFFIMQPCLGLGLAAAKTPKPNLARFRSLLAHSVFGFGIYLSAKINLLLF